MEEKKSGLSGTELCALIKACSESRVSELSLADLYVSFLPTLEQAQQVVWGTQASSPSGTEIPEAADPKKTKPWLEEAEKLLREQQLDDMVALDPLAWEELNSQGELEDRKDATDAEETYGR